MAPRAGTAAVVLIVVLFCLLVAPAPARRPIELPPQVEPDGVDREASVEPLLPKPLEGADAADATVPEDKEVARAHARAHDGLVFRCGGDAAIVSRSDEPLSLDGQARPEPKFEEEDTQGRPYDSDASDTECDTDSDDEEDDEGGIVGWFWRLVDRLI